MQNKSMVIIIIVLVVVLATAAGFAVFFFVRGSNAQQETEVEAAQTIVHLSEEELYDIPFESSIRTNLANSIDGSKHYISLELTVSINNTVKKESDAMVLLLNEKQSIMRNVALTVIRKRTIEELERPDGMEQLERDILTKLQEQFNSNLIVRVASSDIVIN